MKLTSILVILHIFAMPLGFAAEKKLVRLTTGEWSPYVSQKMENKGSLTHLVSQAFALKGYKVEYFFFPWKRSMETARSGEFDGSLSWQPTKEWARHFYFSQPITVLKIVFFHQRSNEFDWSDIGELKEHVIGTTRGYAYSPDFRSEAKKLGLQLIDNDSDLVNFKLLLEGRIDLHPNDQKTGYYLLNTNFGSAGTSQLTHHPKLIFRANQSVIFPKKNRRSRILVEALNQGIRELKAGGNFPELNMIEEDKPQLKVALAHWPPWKVIEEGNYSGIDVEILREIGQRIGVDFRFVECPWIRCIDTLRSGDADLITNFSKTAVRQEFADYLEPPYTKPRIVFYKKKGSPISIQQYEDLLGYQIGVIKGSAYFSPFNTDSRMKKTSVTMELQLMKMLNSGRIDLIVGFKVPMDYVMAREGFSDKFVKLSYSVEGISPSHLAFSKKSKHKSLHAAISTTLEQMLVSGEIQGIIESGIKSAGMSP